MTGWQKHSRASGNLEVRSSRGRTSPDATVPAIWGFRVDLRSGEPYKHGLKIKLQDKPFQVLVTLLERPGHVVTREELRKKLWADDTFVDFEHSINIALNKLRTALGDSAQNPRFIETLARHGYRFLGASEPAGSASLLPGKIMLAVLPFDEPE